MRAKVEIRKDGEHTRIFVDGNEVRRVRGYELTESVEELPTMRIEVMGAPAVVMDNVDVGIYTRYGDSYLEWLDRQISDCDDIHQRNIYRLCRASYCFYFGDRITGVSEETEELDSGKLRETK